MHESSVVTNNAVGANQQVVGDGVLEDLDAKGVGDDLFGLLVEVGVDEGHVVVAADAVAEGGQFLFNSDDLAGLGEGVADVPEFIIRGVAGDEEALLVAGGGPADDAGASDGGLDDRDEGAEFTLEDGVEVVGAPSCDEAVAVGQFSEDADVVRILVLYSVRHELVITFVVAPP